MPNSMIFIVFYCIYLAMIIIRNLYRANLRKTMKGQFDLQEYSYSYSKSKTTKAKQEQTSNLTNQELKTKKAKRKLVFEDHISMFNKILEWRKHNIAPVDTMGCQKLHDTKAPIDVQKYQILVALMLSVQTKDQTTSMIVNRLKEQGLTPENISKIPEQQLRTLIHQSNFNKRKASNIKAVTQTILSKGSIANTLESVMEYPGVGIKIAMLYMKIAEGVINGIGVDTHVHRIANRLGWAKSNSPEETQAQLSALFPQKYWKDINECLVGFGQIRCNAKKPLCQGCPIESSCPSFKLNW